MRRDAATSKAKRSHLCGISSLPLKEMRVAATIFKGRDEMRISSAASLYAISVHRDEICRISSIGSHLSRFISAFA
jgi:hypothetical protein